MSEADLSSGMMSARLAKLSGRLLNLTRSNKTIRLLRKTAARHFDLCELHAFTDGEERSAKALDAITRRRRAVLAVAGDGLAAPVESDDDAEGDEDLTDDFDDDTVEEYIQEARDTASVDAETAAASASGTTHAPPASENAVGGTLVEDSENHVSVDDQPMVIRTWMRRRKIQGFERIDRDLSKLRSFTDSVETETGSQDLHLGWPFLTGVCSDPDKTFLQAPLVLFPVRLVKERKPKAKWTVEAREDADPLFNETLARALENYHQVTLSPELIEAIEDAAATNPRALPKLLADGLLKAGFKLDADSLALATSEIPVESFALNALPEYLRTEIPTEPVGEFAIDNHAVIGYYPQADSSLRLDYEDMRAKLEGGAGIAGHVSMLLAALGEGDGEAREGTENDASSDPLTDSPTSQIVDATSEANQWFVLDTDSSQEEVLLAARREPRLVVHGPPGTGKSQVIVNLISDALMRGERVALVCQKRAALDVVFQRMDSAGLSRHVALVHDHSGDRRLLYQRISSVLTEQLPTARIAEQQLEADLSRLATNIDHLTTRLGQIARDLHQPRKCGHSAQQLYAMLANVPREARQIPEAAAKLAVSLDRAGLDQLKRRIDSLEAIDREIDTSNHPWAVRKSFAGLAQSDRQRIERALETAISACQAASDAIAANPGLTISEATSSAVELALTELIEQLKSNPKPVLDLSETLKRIGIASDIQKRRADTLRQAASTITPVIGEQTRRPTIHCDPDAVAETALRLAEFASMCDSFFRFFKPAFWAAKSVTTEYLAKAGVLPTKALALEHASKLRASTTWREVDALLETFANAKLIAPESAQEILELSDKLAAAAQVASAIERTRSSLPEAIRDVLLPDDPSVSFQTLRTRLEAARDLAAAIATAGKALRALETWINPRRIEQLCTAGMAQPRLAENTLLGLLRGLSAFDLLEAWDTGYGGLLPEARVLVLTCRDGGLGGWPVNEPWSTQVAAAVHSAWIERIERDAPSLRDVARREADTMRPELANAISTRRVKLRQLLATKLLRNSLNARFEPGREVDRRHSYEKPWKDLGYQVSKKSRHYSLRRLYAEFAWPLMNVMPCWLVSPETMSAVFPNKQGVFDLVIFDEASQCPVENGLPAAARGTRVVIAGDEQQLRPSDLFKSIGSDEEETDEDEGDHTAVEAESLLTLARARYPERMLTWHYRSKFEELIDFSNHGFYQARLKTVPDLFAKREPPPIEYVKVEGLWENRCNPREAAAVAELLFNKLKGEWAGKTVGVVTFGMSQRAAIESHIEKRRNQDDTFNAIFEAAFRPASGHLDDALFIKNIENVQGDERDIIVFSVGYARDSRGRMVSSFGSLSTDGGENRLNVAVSRARERIVVVASIEPSDLNVANAKNRGPRLFKNYLEYARAVSQENEESRQGVLKDIGGGMARGHETSLTFDSPFEEMVHQALEAENMLVRSQVGVSGYRIDLAVVDPNDPSRYCLGIECDGATYHSAPSVRERDVYRQRTLEMRGWKIHRIWSRNWWADKQAEVQKVRAIVAHGGHSPSIKPPPTDAAATTPDSREQ